MLRSRNCTGSSTGWDCPSQILHSHDVQWTAGLCVLSTTCWYNWSVFEIFCSLEHAWIFLIIIISSLVYSNIGTYIMVTPFDGKLFFTLGNCYEKLCHENKQIQIWVCNSVHCGYSNAKPREVMTILFFNCVYQIKYFSRSRKFWQLKKWFKISQKKWI